MCNILLKGALVVAAFTVWSVAASAGDLDEAEVGPFEVVTSAYKLPAAIDPEVASDVATELWATVYRPIPLGREPHPLLMFLHGNYVTCGHIVSGVGRVDDSIEYTFDGKCPPGCFPIQSQLGYGGRQTSAACSARESSTMRPPRCWQDSDVSLREPSSGSSMHTEDRGACVRS